MRRARHILTVFLLPAILYVLGSYRLIGVRASWNWGNFNLKPKGVTKSQYIFGYLFPAVVLTALGVYAKFT
jgi:hypothetical protein